MIGAPDNHELDKRLAVLEERMNTMQAHLKASEERLNGTLERIEASNANLKVWVTATAIALGGLLFAALRLWPPSG